jgi:hypothetical protein
MEDSYREREMDGILLGCSVPVDVAVEVLRRSRARYPDLKFVLLTSDMQDLNTASVHYRIALGCPSDITQSAHCQEWSASDFEKLDPEMQLDEFHHFVRSLHPYPLDTVKKTAVTFRGGSQDGISVNFAFSPPPEWSVTHPSGGGEEIYDLRVDAGRSIYVFRASRSCE